MADETDNETLPSTQPLPKRTLAKILAIALILGIIGTLYYTWNNTQSQSTTQPIAVQTPLNSINTNKSSDTTTSTNTASIEAYIVGAVKHPGVYTLANGARVFQLVNAAGGPLPNANLVAINLAALLKDGEELYIPLVGETMPANINNGNTSNSTATSQTGNTTATGQLVNINTASATEMQTQLHISSKTAQTIIDYRLQHGPYTSVEQLAGVVSKTIYDKIKGMVTV